MKGMDSALSTARAVCVLGRYGTNGISVCSICFIPACLWITAGGFRLWTFPELVPPCVGSSRNSRSSILRSLSSVSFACDEQTLLNSSRTRTRSMASSAVAQGKVTKVTNVTILRL